jgi:hypothetical protein
MDLMTSLGFACSFPSAEGGGRFGEVIVSPPFSSISVITLSLSLLSTTKARAVYDMVITRTHGALFFVLYLGRANLELFFVFGIV